MQGTGIAEYGCEKQNIVFTDLVKCADVILIGFKLEMEK
jgi:hypothetical protein